MSKSTSGNQAAKSTKPEVDAPARDEAAPEVSSDPNASVTDERNGARKYVSEAELTTEAIIQRRTSTLDGGPEWPADGRYHKVFNIAVPRVSTGKAPKLDWTAPEHDAMHEANKVAVLQEAMMRGLHPRDEAAFAGQLGDTDEAAGSASLEYTVEVVPATTDPEQAATTYTPSAAIADQGGTTLPEADSWSDQRQ